MFLFLHSRPDFRVSVAFLIRIDRSLEALGRTIGSGGIVVGKPKYRRVVLKLSGEAMAGGRGSGIDTSVVSDIALQVKEIVDMGVQVGIVVGGGNIWRGAVGGAAGIDRTTADYMGMLATVLNALALQDGLEKVDVETRVQTAIEMREVAEPYIRRKATNHLEHGRVVIFAAGTGNPYFTTDTTAALRAAEIDAEVILLAKGTVDGVYDADPKLVPDARMFRRLTYLEVIQRGLKVMDTTATSLCMDNNIPLVVFGLATRGNIRRAIMGEDIGTYVGGES